MICTRVADGELQTAMKGVRSWSLHGYFELSPLTDPVFFLSITAMIESHVPPRTGERLTGGPD